MVQAIQVLRFHLLELEKVSLLFRIPLYLKTHVDYLRGKRERGKMKSAREIRNSETQEEFVFRKIGQHGV